MSNIQTQKMQALSEHYRKFDCAHEGEKELRKRTVKGGGIQYVYQCLTCGVATSGPIAKTKAIEINGGSEPAPFDTNLMNNWEEKKEEGARQIMGRFEEKSHFLRSEFNKWYDEYLKSPEWKSIRKRVMDRAKNQCEGCGLAEAEEVHHLTYKHVGEEFLFELVALCGSCHERYHSDQDDE